jgi:hypothetical protein
MSDSKKTIQINPDFLKLPGVGGKTRKKRPDKEIKMKVPNKTENTKTTKRKILNYIRKQQEDTYKHLLKDEIAVVKPMLEPKTDFEKSLEFLENVVKAPPAPKNVTLKQYPVIPHSIIDENVAIIPPENVFDAIVPPIFQSEPLINLAKPNYGCLKGGTLPTYRAWKAQTQKNTGIDAPLTLEQNRAELRQFLKKRKDEKHKVAKAKTPIELKKHQKRTMRRTFRVGKSKVYSRVGVLVSNRTIRNQIQSQCQALKETPIEDVKKYLVKHGFIRVGSSTPYDVLRKIYESAMLMCGEIKNHNPDNLLFNYLNNGIDV